MKDMDLLLLMCAFRYALGRRSYVVSAITSHLISVWGTIHELQRTVITAEINLALRDGKAGDEMDREQWQRVVS
jgi:hypothetical protein